jgi:hypothetical protein
MSKAWSKRTSFEKFHAFLVQALPSPPALFCINGAAQESALAAIYLSIEQPKEFADSTCFRGVSYKYTDFGLRSRSKLPLFDNFHGIGSRFWLTFEEGARTPAVWLCTTTTPAEESWSRAIVEGWHHC